MDTKYSPDDLKGVSEMAPSLDRRTLLRAGSVALGTAVAGCNRNVDDLSSSETTEGETADTDRSASGTRGDRGSPTGPAADTTPEIPFETPSLEDCTVSDRPQPTPTAGTRPKEYPQYPDSLTAPSAEAYAAEYERAYHFNSYLDSEGNSDTRQLSVSTNADDSLTEETADGFLVGAEGELSVTQGTVAEDNPLVGVYYLTSDIGLRADISEPTLYDVESLRSVAVTKTQTVYCRNSSDE